MHWTWVNIDSNWRGDFSLCFELFPLFFYSFSNYKKCQNHKMWYLGFDGLIYVMNRMHRWVGTKTTWNILLQRRSTTLQCRNEASHLDSKAVKLISRRNNNLPLVPSCRTSSQDISRKHDQVMHCGKPESCLDFHASAHWRWVPEACFPVVRPIFIPVIT